MDNDIRHTFDIRFKMLLYTSGSIDEIKNITTFNVLPVYWTAICVPGKGFVNGWTNMFVLGRDIISASIPPVDMRTSACGVPSMSYSASLIFTGSTVFSSSPVTYTQEVYDR